jgi:REP element-mobilizing transposase RayT
MVPFMGKPLGHFITWTTYGTWLHGDRRGSVDRDHRQRGEEFLPHNKGRRTYARSIMKESPLILSPKQRRVVEQAIAGVCAYREWELLAVNCRTNHVHVVVAGPDMSGEQVMRQFKAYATRALREILNLKRQRIWTEGGSTRYLNHESALYSAVEYTNHQERDSRE